MLAKSAERAFVAGETVVQLSVPVGRQSEQKCQLPVSRPARPPFYRRNWKFCRQWSPADVNDIQFSSSTGPGVNSNSPLAGTSWHEMEAQQPPEKSRAAMAIGLRNRFDFFFFFFVLSLHCWTLCPLFPDTLGGPANAIQFFCVCSVMDVMDGQFNSSSRPCECRGR